MNITSKPNRKQLIKVISELQDMISSAKTYHGNDRNPHGFERGQKTLENAFELCVDARSFDPP
ncbi:MAG: hypothetical protein KAS32_23575 [Candidatus Peribacteraceae bacterium]|nr:hypothetical protein [Candidatus Peribacteraceae bacterium]